MFWAGFLIATASELWSGVLKSLVGDARWNDREERKEGGKREEGGRKERGNREVFVILL